MYGLNQLAYTSAFEEPGGKMGLIARVDPQQGQCELDLQTSCTDGTKDLRKMVRCDRFTAIVRLA